MKKERARKSKQTRRSSNTDIFVDKQRFKFKIDFLQLFNKIDNLRSIAVVTDGELDFKELTKDKKRRFNVSNTVKKQNNFF